MTTNLKINSGSDFDDAFQAGGGTQLFGIYGSDGQDIGQRYLPSSRGQAYGATGFQQAQGSDVGNLLCKAGTNDLFTLVIGKQDNGPYEPTFGFEEGKYGSLSPQYFLGYKIIALHGKVLQFEGYVQPWPVLYMTVNGSRYTSELFSIPTGYQGYQFTAINSLCSTEYYYGDGILQIKLEAG